MQDHQLPARLKMLEEKVAEITLALDKVVSLLDDIHDRQSAHPEKNVECSFCKRLTGPGFMVHEYCLPCYLQRVVEKDTGSLRYRRK